jgi:KUP system potassium uptake protein
MDSDEDEHALGTHGQATSARHRALLALTALGVVFGDIGTSPLYAVRECFSGPYAVPLDETNVLGLLSLIFWSLIFVISIKYLVFILRADNHGEGGILALAALVLPRRGQVSVKGKAVLFMGLFGAALLYGDGMITPAISVLSAVEGLSVAAPSLEHWVIPITLVILVLLFAMQSQGTARVGAIFGPLTLIWFICLILLGLPQIIARPEILAALDPRHAVAFFGHNGLAGFKALGAVFLVVTGGEALYADMGHFGAKPIRLDWFAVVLPALVINYLGQGALLLGSPDAIENPFYRMAPEWALLPLVILATMATVIASQAVISGAFSLTMQAVRLGYCPRLDIRHTSATERGQIYIPAVNWALMVACIGLVLGFRSSGNLAAAYGIAVGTTMIITTLLFAVVARRRWRWSAERVFLLTTLFLSLDLVFFGANLVKFFEGGWFPLTIAALVFTVMATWSRGREILASRLRERALPLQELLRENERMPVRRVPGTAVYMFRSERGAPPALRRNIRFNHVLHERAIILVIQTLEVPRVAPDRRIRTEELGQGFYRVVARYGFMERPDVPALVAELPALGLDFDPEGVTYFLGRETLVATARPGMALWREHLFVLMSRNARDASSYFELPPEQVVEMGARIEL